MANNMPYQYKYQVHPGFAYCGCGYQLENCEAKCRRCGGMDPLTNYTDFGRSDLPWYGLFKWEWDTLDNDAKNRHVSECLRREWLKEWLPANRQFVYIPPHLSPNNSYMSFRQDQVPATFSQSHGPTVSYMPLQSYGYATMQPSYPSQASTPVAPMQVQAQTMPPSVSLLVPPTPPPPPSTQLQTNTEPPVAQVQPAQARVPSQQEAPVSLTGLKISDNSVHSGEAENVAKSKFQVYTHMMGQPSIVPIPSFPTLPKASPEVEAPIPKALLKKQNLIIAVDPKLPNPPCSPKNHRVWPEDQYWFNEDWVGFTREKVFPGARCFCGEPHPKELHENHHEFFETLIALWSHPTGERLCQKCQPDNKLSKRHTTEQHSRMGFYDHPENPEVPPGHLEQFLRPWAYTCGKEPLPKYYYRPDLFPRPKGRYHDFHVFKEGEPGFSTAYINNNSKKEVQLRDAIMRAQRIQNIENGLEEEDIESEETEQSGKAGSTKQNAKSKKAESKPQTAPPKQELAIKPASNPSSCTCGPDPRHGLVPCPKVSQKKLIWFNPDFETAMKCVMVAADVAKVNSHKSAFDNSVVEHNNSRVNVNLNALSSRAAAFEIYSTYFPYVREGQNYKEKPEKFDKELKKFRAMREQHTTTPVEAEVPESGSRSELVRCDASKLSIDAGFESSAVEKQVLRSDSDAVYELGEAPEGYLLTEGIHHDIWAKSDQEAYAQVTHWANHLREKTQKKTTVAFRKWYESQVDDALTPLRVIVLLDANKVLWQQKLQYLKGGLFDSVLELMGDLSKVITEVETKVITMQLFETVNYKIATAFLRYSNTQREVRDYLFKPESKGLGQKIAQLVEIEHLTHWAYLQGQILPGESPVPACLSRWAWPARFEEHLQSL